VETIAQIKGAFPPSSIEVRFTVDALCSINFLQILVDPVNVTLQTVGFGSFQRRSLGPRP
jgi:hypothetical protein